MQRWIVCLLLLAGSPVSPALACGFYPVGEEVRFHLLEPQAFGFKDLEPFCYTTHYFSAFPEAAGRVDSGRQEYDGNIRQWANYCRHKVSAAAIDSAVYELSAYDIQDADSHNGMLRYLYASGDTAAVNYLVFAKSCEVFNGFYSDEWEHTDVAQIPHQQEQIDAALAYAARQHNKNLRSRYAFLAVRMAYYSNHYSIVKAAWKKYFQHPATAIDYWAMHFRALAEDSGVLKNYYAAQVFWNAPEKRVQIFQRWDRAIPAAATLKYAHTAEERAAVWFMTGLHNPARAMQEISELNRYAPHSEALSFLLMRELSKLEDWIYTPYYTYFNPTLPARSESIMGEISAALQNLPGDRRYAAGLLRFVQAGSAGTRSDPALWRVSAAWLNAMTGRNEAAVTAVNALQRQLIIDSSVRRQSDWIKAICLTARQRCGHTTIPEMAKPLLMAAQQAHNNRFLFAIGRELEYKGAATEAALLFSKTNAGADRWGETDGVAQTVFWRSRRHSFTLGDDYYSDYFYYIDAQYTPAQLTALIDAAILKPAPADSFSQWACKEVVGDKDRLYDLLGTKYIRRNELGKALTAFREVNDTLYTSKNYGYNTYLDANPFYTNLYNEHTPTKADTARFTKAGITARLIEYLQLAQNRSTPNRAYCYFLAANCYLNMTQHGNSWMMRRYYWSGNGGRTNLEDDAEYFGAVQAQHYYLLAKAATAQKTFGALCLRMAGRCEKYRLMDVLSGHERWRNDVEDTILFRKNKYWAQLKREYPDDYDELISNCTVFEQYFAAAR